MGDQAITAGELYRLFAILGAAVVGLSAVTSALAAFLTSRRTSRKEDHEEGARREQLRNLGILSLANEERWRKHDEITDARVEEFRQTQSAVAVLTGTVDRLREDTRAALQASAEASRASASASAAIAVLTERIAAGIRTVAREMGREFTSEPPRGA